MNYDEYLFDTYRPCNTFHVAPRQAIFKFHCISVTKAFC